MRRIVVAALVASGCVIAAPPAYAADNPLHRQHLTWHGCQRGPQDTEGQALDRAGAQCAGVTVPLDYTHPRGRSITVALSRLRATDTANRIGAMVVNLGGPGIPVLGTVPLARQAMGAAGARFDLIGMDPRFVGRSTPLDCGWPGNWGSRSAGADRYSFDRMVALSRDLARRCAQRYRDVLPFASTANMARDLDVVRAVLGEPKLSYLGYSYGSYLGALYTQLFPRRADRMVLDSAIDPAQPGTFKGRDSGPLREAALGGQLSTVESIYQAAARHPLRVGPYLVDDTAVPGLVLDPLSDDGPDSTAELAATVQVLATAAAGGTVQPTPALDAALAGMLTGADSALHSAQTAIVCADGAVPRDPEFYWRDIERHRAEAPLFGPLSRTISPCAFWPTGPVEPRIRVHNAVPALVVNAAGDINATIGMGRAMHRALAGSRMITLDGVRTHGVYLFRGNGCVNDAVNTYLVSGALPGADLTCR
jgi:pimeloyl-ACP methyl ester carboxylesterase